MNSFQKHARLLAVSTILVAGSFGQAHAQSVEAALERLKVLSAEQGITLDWASMDVSGSDAVLVDVTVGAEGEAVPIGNITFTGITETDTGHEVQSVSMDTYSADDGEGSTLSVSGVEVTGLIIPGEGQEAAFGGYVFYDTADIGSVIVNAKGKDVFTLSDLHVEVAEPVNGSPMDFTGAAEGFTVDLSVIEDPQQTAILQQLGYLQLQGFFEMAGSWQPTDGRLALSQYDLTVVDAGTLGFSFDLGGYTTEFMASLRELQQQMAENPEGGSSAQGLAMMGLMQQLTFHGAEIAFTDDSLTNKILGFVAQMQGMTPDDIKNQAKAVLPFALAQLNNSELTQMATRAVSAFLDNPQSLRIAAEPAEPVPFALIGAGAMGNPADLTKTLAVKVYANE